jgi:tryptophanyl-tRNA synthetase
VLMAADITLYKADTVPVGVDQAAHLEFTREIVRRFNYHFGPTLIEPQIKLTDFPKVLGTDGVNKMSKTLDNHIELASSPEEILERVMTMVTDPARRYRTDPGHPEICNVFTLHKHLSPDDAPQIETDCRNATIGCVEHKKWFAKDLADYLAPFRARRAEFAADPNYVWEVLTDGAERAQAIAKVTIAEVKERVGLP